MMYSDSTNKSGIVEKVRFLTKTTAETYPIRDITREVNNALDKYFVIAMNANNDWELDDTTYSDYAIATTALTSGQRDYQLPTSLIDILSISAKDNTGSWYKLTPIDQAETVGVLEEIYESNAMPMFYDKRSDGVFLYPASNYTSAGGLKIEYKRIANYFLHTDTTKVAGIPLFHHEYLALIPATVYDMKEGKGMGASQAINLQKMEESIKSHWSKRGKDKKLQIRPAYNSPE